MIHGLVKFRGLGMSIHDQGAAKRISVDYLDKLELGLLSKSDFLQLALCDEFGQLFFLEPRNKSHNQQPNDLVLHFRMYHFR